MPQNPSTPEGAPRFAARPLAQPARPFRAVIALTFAVVAVAAPLWGQPQATSVVPDHPAIAAEGYVLMDADTGKILAEENSQQPLPPASLAKIMTGYVVAAELEAGRINLSDDVPVSVNAWETPGSRMFIREGTTVVLEDLLRGVVIQSGNDASVALAEFVAGGEDAFADMMNQHAALLGMPGSMFANSTGLPHESQYTTARDLAVLTQQLIRRFPDHYAMYSERSFKYNGIEQPNRNRLLWRDRTVDGVKTGYTKEAGYCLVASAERDGMRLISALMGAESDAVRVRESQKLLSYGFRYFETHKLYGTEAPLKTSEVRYGQVDEVSMGIPEAIFVTIPRGRYQDIAATLDIPEPLEAPIAAGDELGELRVTLDGETLATSPLIARDPVLELETVARFFEGIYFFFHDLVK